MNLPLEMHGRTILLAGAGGGWDIFGALPLAQEWRTSNRLVWASYSARRESPTLQPAQDDDHPEGPLARLLDEPLYVFGKAGVRRLRRGYEELVARHAIDTVVLIDGGVDSLMRGDEEGPGTILQDAISLGAVSDVGVAQKILACVGFGAETEEGVCHYRALENMAALTKAGHFLGACALTNEMEAFGYYEEICRRVFAQPGTRSHIHTRIIPAVHGDFGRCEMFDDADQPLDLLADRPPFVCPLMPLYWFFEAAGVAQRNLLVGPLAATETWSDVEATYAQLFPRLGERVRPNREIPL